MVVVLGTGVLLLGKIAMTLLRGFKMYIFFFKKRYLIFTFKIQGILNQYTDLKGFGRKFSR